MLKWVEIINCISRNVTWIIYFLLDKHFQKCLRNKKKCTKRHVIRWLCPLCFCCCTLSPRASAPRRSPSHRGAPRPSGAWYWVHAYQGALWPPLHAARVLWPWQRRALAEWVLRQRLLPRDHGEVGPVCRGGESQVGRRALGGLSRSVHLLLFNWTLSRLLWKAFSHKHYKKTVHTQMSTTVYIQVVILLSERVRCRVNKQNSSSKIRSQIIWTEEWCCKCSCHCAPLSTVVCLCWWLYCPLCDLWLCLSQTWRYPSRGDSCGDTYSRTDHTCRPSQPWLWIQGQPYRFYYSNKSHFKIAL